MNQDQRRWEKELGGVPPEELCGYLEAAGGTEEPAHPSEGESTVADTNQTAPTRCFRGDRWTASITPLPPRKLGSLNVDRVQLEITGAGEPMDTLVETLERKLIRIGG